MHEPNESGTAGETENNSPSDTLPPRRRRRAASRPAGPPTAAAGSTEAAEVTADIAETPVVADVAEAEAA
ncbi:hypothetical protein, partial [Streptomyces sp.]